MKAFVLKERGQNGRCEFCEKPDPELTDEYSAILTPIAMSVCTSDVSTVFGEGSRKEYDLIIGHECVARVVKVGARVQDFKPGDRVAVPPITPDWRHPQAQIGNDRHAGKAFSSNQIGRTMPGVFAEYFAIKDADMTLAKVPEQVSDAAALMTVDMLNTGFTGAEAAEIRYGDTVVVMGIGGVGLMAIAGARMKGAGRIIAIGSRTKCVELAYYYGATEVISYKDTDVVQYVKDATGGVGSDVTIICGGGDDALMQAMDMTCYGIGRVVNLKLYSGSGDLPISKFSAGKGLGGKTIRMELCKGGRAWMERLLDLVRYDRIDPAPLVTHTMLGFDQIATALQLMRNKEDDLVKTMVIPEWK